MARAKISGGSAGRSPYDRFKEFQGRRYTGMAVGRGHKWKYEAGDWTEKKITPDKWEIQYGVKKHRKGHAPEGSGAPVGTSHRWYILAEQVVTKLDANTYSTELKGTKYKVAHKRAGKDAWSASDRAQRRALVRILREAITEAERASPDAPPVRPAEAPSPAMAATRPVPGGQRSPRKRTRRGLKRSKPTAVPKTKPHGARA
jgi:hypothetical protein